MPYLYPGPRKDDRDPNGLEFTDADLVNLSDLEKEDTPPRSRKISSWSEESNSDGDKCKKKEKKDDGSRKQDKSDGENKEKKRGKIGNLMEHLSDFAGMAVEFVKAIPKRPGV
ncbi:hypothetical protein CC80DRAFT_591744 [Byssothecium circinans]|uniref:Uncharacterized protein n=1 Tax=Byssothecium circinans TaxID=147558 RepID=A0A6A5U1M4_9PLEO|nr:hypothetical protein CC80DRAFT_591744 [Byssothecium circinans]